MTLGKDLPDIDKDNMYALLFDEIEKESCAWYEVKDAFESFLITCEYKNNIKQNLEMKVSLGEGDELIDWEDYDGNKYTAAQLLNELNEDSSVIHEYIDDCYEKQQREEQLQEFIEMFVDMNEREKEGALRFLRFKKQNAKANLFAVPAILTYEPEENEPENIDEALAKFIKENENDSYKAAHAMIQSLREKKLLENLFRVSGN